MSEMIHKSDVFQFPLSVLIAAEQDVHDQQSVLTLSARSGHSSDTENPTSAGLLIGDQKIYPSPFPAVYFKYSFNLSTMHGSQNKRAGLL
jgi:hypothetical protein